MKIVIFLVVVAAAGAAYYFYQHSSLGEWGLPSPSSGDLRAPGEIFGHAHCETDILERIAPLNVLTPTREFYEKLGPVLKTYYRYLGRANLTVAEANEIYAFSTGTRDKDALVESVRETMSHACPEMMTNEEKWPLVLGTFLSVVRKMKSGENLIRKSESYL